MTNYYPQAGEAIGSVVRETHPDDSHNWGNVVPSSDWGTNVARWADMRDTIRARFAALIAPCAIRPGEQFSGFRDKPLYQLQERMANSVVCDGDGDSDDEAES